MSESSAKQGRRAWRIRHKGRSSQVLIYLGKQFRFFIYENDWKVLPMAAIIAALVGMVIRSHYYVDMEGSLFGSFALICAAIWNGCFNSIQAVCRERAIVKREHRSGMHISAYVAAHMIYQLMLCVLQTGLTVYVLIMLGVNFPMKGIITEWMILDVAITLLLVSYASDMMSLFLSSISRTTTGAMTIIPFVLIFQLVFSGGLIPLPEWSQSISNFTFANYGVRALTSQSGYNDLPMVTLWQNVTTMRESEVGGTVTLGQVMDVLDSPVIDQRRDTVVMKSYTVGEAAEILNSAEESLHLRDREVARPVTLREVFQFVQDNSLCADLRATELLPAIEEHEAVTVGSLLTDILADPEAQTALDTEFGPTITLGQVLDFLHAEEVTAAMSDQVLNAPLTLGEIVDFVKNNPALQAQRDRTFTLKTTVGELIDIFGEDAVRDLVQRKTSAASHKDIYEGTPDNITYNWWMLGAFIAVFAILATLALEFIDKDKR